uniref:Uncharacterized protein n=1 Tax=Oryza glumipatula TaxID=40148 RepID=A0A0E0A6D4_9ORYZ
MANLAIEYANMVLSPISLSGWILSNFQCQLKQEDKWAKFMSNFLRFEMKKKCYTYYVVLISETKANEPIGGST